MQCGGKRNLRPYEGQIWRVVEAQHRNATRRLVDSDASAAVQEFTKLARSTVPLMIRKQKAQRGSSIRAAKNAR